jgi:N-methylhydantoinase B
VENNRFPAWGVAGGKGGGLSRVVLNPGTPEEREVRAFSDDNQWKRGDVVRICTAGGGGWGDPLEREGELVLDDVKDGFVSPEAALNDYGVLIDVRTLAIDMGATIAKREEMRRGRGKTRLFHRFDYFDSEAEELEWVNRNMPR